MIRILEDRIIEGDLHYIKAAGLSTDQKPTSGIITGSEYTAADTGEKFMFAEGDSPTWTQVVSGFTDTDAEG